MLTETLRKKHPTNVRSCATNAFLYIKSQRFSLFVCYVPHVFAARGGDVDARGSFGAGVVKGTLVAVQGLVLRTDGVINMEYVSK